PPPPSPTRPSSDLSSAPADSRALGAAPLDEPQQRRRRVASASPSPGFRQQRKPLRGAPEGLLRGPAPGLETRYRRRSHSRYRDTGPETGFGGGELTDRCRWGSLQRGPDRPTAGLSHRRNSRGW